MGVCIPIGELRDFGRSMLVAASIRVVMLAVRLWDSGCDTEDRYFWGR